MGFSINSSGGWLPVSRPAAGVPARPGPAPASGPAPERSPAVRPASPAPARGPEGASDQGSGAERLQRIRALNLEQSFGMALYQGAGRTRGGAGRHLDLRV